MSLCPTILTGFMVSCKKKSHFAEWNQDYLWLLWHPVKHTSLAGWSREICIMDKATVYCGCMAPSSTPPSQVAVPASRLWHMANSHMSVVSWTRELIPLKRKVSIFLQIRILFLGEGWVTFVLFLKLGQVFVRRLQYCWGCRAAHLCWEHSISWLCFCIAVYLYCRHLEQTAWKKEAYGHIVWRAVQSVGSHHPLARSLCNSGGLRLSHTESLSYQGRD